MQTILAKQFLLKNKCLLTGKLWISEQVIFCPDVLQTQVFKPAVQV